MAETILTKHPANRPDRHSGSETALGRAVPGTRRYRHSPDTVTARRLQQH